MEITASYRTETRQVMIGKQMFAVMERIPLFSDDERNRVKQMIEYGLYRIFEKFSHS